MYELYLWIHIVSGGTALVSCFVAALAKFFPWKHRIHQWSGRAFFTGMTGVFGSTLIMTALKPNIFLLLIGIFSYYFAWTGWRLAKNRQGAITPLDIGIPAGLAVAAAGMIGYGLYLLVAVETGGMWTVLVIFGLVGAAQAVKDVRNLRRQPYIGKARIASHLQMMLAASIAAITAFLVVNVEIENQFILWMLPTVVITPLISWWSKQVALGKVDDPS